MKNSYSYDIDARVLKALDAFELPPKLGFGAVMAPLMYRADYRDGSWLRGGLQPYGVIAMEPGAKALHYGQEFFEGLKAYKVHQRRATLFRPVENWKRMNSSARRLCMPELSETLFMEGIGAVAAACEPIIPGNPGQSLYLRPFVIGTQADLGIAVSDSFSFFVIASPSEVIHAGHMQVLIERETSRAALGGTGSVKVGGNYAAALLSAGRAREFGYHHSLWLDPRERRYVEELSAMNFFALIDGELHTPALSGSILPGITRDSVIELARTEGLAVHERRMEVDELIADIRSGRCSEAFACGTAAVISPISMLGEADATQYPLSTPEGDLTSHLRQRLFDIQEGVAEDDFGWSVEVSRCFYRTEA